MRESSRFIGVLLVLAFCQLAAARAYAAAPNPLPPGMGKYVMVLWPAGSPIPAGGPPVTMKSVPEPDVVQLGGQVLAKADNQRLILLPLAAAAELRRHEAVVYLQRIWTGESLAGWNESYQALPGPRLHVTPNADTNLQWGPKSYTYDGSGNIKSIGSDQYTDQYAYDFVGRLSQATVQGKTESYKYDAFGNLTEKGVAGANPVTIAVDGASNRLLGVSYDAAGNATSANDGRRTYKYDSMNMLTLVKTNTGTDRRMIYDANDERIGMLNGDTLSRWNIRDFEGRVIREYKADNLGAWKWEQDYFYGEGSLIGGETQEWGYMAAYRWGGRRHYHLDHLGSVRMVTTDASGTNRARSISEHDYFPFGTTMKLTFQEQLNGADPHVDSMRFAGHWRDFLGVLNVDNTTDYLDYMHARYYDPSLGRFLSVDPKLDIEESMRQPQAWNRYAYVLNNPLRYTDPDGREHVNEPGFTKSLTENDWSEAPPVFKAAFYIQAAGFMLAAEEFAGPVVAAFRTVRTVTRYMGAGEAETARKTGNIPNTDAQGNPRLTHVTTDKPMNDAAAAEQKYTLPVTPTNRATVPKSRVPGLGPAPGGPRADGGGSQSVTTQPIPVKPSEIKPLNQSLWDRVLSWFK